MPGCNTKGLTALLRSAASIDQDAFCGGQALDVSVDAGLMAHVSERHAFQAALQTYFAQGGLQVQVNGVTAQTLREAMAKPAEHENLLVRIAGFSARFVGLGHGIQEEMAHRFEHGV
jgi:formate C-acetyltransferase